MLIADNNNNEVTVGTYCRESLLMMLPCKLLLVSVGTASVHKQLIIETVEHISFWCAGEAVLAAMMVVEHRTNLKVEFDIYYYLSQTDTIIIPICWLITRAVTYTCTCR